MSAVWLDITDAFELAVELLRPLEQKLTEPRQHDAHVTAYYREVFLDQLEAAWITGNIILTGIEPVGDKRTHVPKELADDYCITFYMGGRLIRREPKPHLFLGCVFLDDSKPPPEGQSGMPPVAFYSLHVQADDIRRLFAPTETPAATSIAAVGAIEAPAISAEVKPRGRRGEKTLTAKKLLHARYGDIVPSETDLPNAKLFREIEASFGDLPLAEKPSFETVMTAAGRRVPSKKRRKNNQAE